MKEDMKNHHPFCREEYYKHKKEDGGGEWRCTCDFLRRYDSSRPEPVQGEPSTELKLVIDNNSKQYSMAGNLLGESLGTPSNGLVEITIKQLIDLVHKLEDKGMIKLGSTEIELLEYIHKTFGTRRVPSVGEIRKILSECEYKKEDFDVMGCIQLRKISIEEALDLLSNKLHDFLEGYDNTKE